ncbi:chromate transporter [Methylocapsa aurea]|uniref:chromate transporter n=1 Tax=Methylocapsa aurea TaxID=663610 RepID=UPI000568EE4D|nr:chromate transporter [Methylocapsa aurea]
MRSILGQIGLTFSVMSLAAVGGANATLPEIHREVVGALHLMDDATFARLVTIAQTAPGPNVLVASAIGLHLAGLGGLCVATLAMILPSSLVALGAGRTMRHFSSSRAILVLKKSLAPIAIGLMLASGLIMARAADRGGLTIAITAGMTLVIAFTRLNPLWGIATGAILGLACGRLGLSL